MDPRASRNRRRPEKKPKRWLLLLLVVILCIGSFIGGQWLARDRPKMTSAEAPPSPEKFTTEVTPAPSVGPPNPSGAENLTFFDTLAKGEQHPLGSGINTPPNLDATGQQASQPPQKTLAEEVPGKPVPPVTVAKTVPASVALNEVGAYQVQAASFARQEDAQIMYARLLKKNYPVSLQTAQLGERGTWYRIMVGPFETFSAAERIVARLQGEEKLSAMIRKR
jgi:cell division septation protein DedD